MMMDDVMQGIQRAAEETEMISRVFDQTLTAELLCSCVVVELESFPPLLLEVAIRRCRHC